MFLTIRALTNEPGGAEWNPLVGYYEWPPYDPTDPALDEVAGTLTFKVRVVNVRTGLLARPYDFSILVLEP